MRGPEDGCAPIFRNVNKYLQGDSSQHPRELVSLKFFSFIPTSSVGRTLLLVLQVQGIIAYWVQLPVSEPDHSPASNAEVKMHEAVPPVCHLSF